MFELFFRTKSDTTLRKAIENIDVEKLKKICNFLNGKSQSTSSNSLNLIAILVGYELRPYSFFLNSNLNDKNFETASLDKFNDPIKSIVQEIEPQEIESNKNFKKKIAIGFLGLIGLTSIGYTAKNIIAPEPQCMQWQDDHYEKVDCEMKNVLGTYITNQIEVIDENVINLKKIDVNLETTFFVKNKAVVYYCKMNDSIIEYYNESGFHPILDKPLKPITRYIIEKYVIK